MSGDPTPPDPDQLTASAPEAAAEEAGQAATDSRLTDHPVVEGLLSTTPKGGTVDTPREQAIRGVKKFLNGALGAKVSSGQTAAQDFIEASIGYYQESNDEQQDGRAQHWDDLDGDQPPGDNSVDWSEADE